jgi:predicted DNA-binding transcriptional regulator AlpA
MPVLLSQRQAAEYLGVSPRTLERWRVTGDGPSYIKLGRRVAYRECDLIEHVAARVRTSTSEVRP